MSDSLNTVPSHIVAIGASAGGLEELNSFFDHTPADGISYVIVQHLSTTFKSKMAELLGKHSKLTISEAQDDMPIRVNEVYLIPNDKYLTIQNNRFHLSNKTDVHPPHLTIDKFFKSLARNSGQKAIAVILSGLGSDGTEGVKAIKEAGGIAIARDPETTEFASMPSNAIATGLIDFVLEPESIPRTIEEYIKYGTDLLARSPEDEAYLGKIISYVGERLPLDFSNYKPNTILRRIKRRAAAHNFTTLDSYLDYVKTNPGEVEALAQDFLISVTAFFRDPEAYKFLESDIIPVILEKLSPGEEVKVWVTGCATGEEAYSLAILFHEQLVGPYANKTIKIFATDLDAVALIQAGKGAYSSDIEKDVSTARLEKYFTRDGSGYNIKPEIRKMLVFAQHDLVKNPPFCNMHLISCRNLLIYMNSVLQKKVYSMLLFGLRLDGYLFLGSSETPQPILQYLEVVNKKWRIYRNLETKRIIHFDGFSLPQTVDVTANRSSTARFLPPEKEGNSLAEAMTIALVEELDYLALTIDENNLVLKTYGNTVKYLLQKNFNLNLPELLPRPLAVAFNTAIIKARETREKVSIAGIDVKIGDQQLKVILSAQPLKAKNFTGPLYMVIFSEDKSGTISPGRETGLDEKIYLDQYTLLLEEEMNELKEKLQSAYKELDASKDNMQSYVEELLSANEEMQSTNEEMQSVNEELQTINADSQLKNKELLDLNDDLNNYFRSNQNGQLFVNADLTVMKFSPATVKIVNLVPADFGRPLKDISMNIKSETIIADIKKVLSDGQPITSEVETINGNWYQVTTMPYIPRGSGKQNGAIVTFNDITALKEIQKELDKRNSSLMRINDDLNNFVTTASHDLVAPLGNIEMSIAVMNSLKVADPELSEFLSVINASIKKFRALIGEISTIAKIENDAIAKEKLDIAEAIADVEWSLEEKIRQNKAVIKTELNVPKIYFSRKNFRSMLFNLISNAVKFRSKRDPVITVRTYQDGNKIMLTVEDNGIGISADDIDKIWGMYHRLDPDIEGQGLGMFLTKKIVNSAGGEIGVESVPDKGTKFVISLPV